MITFPCYATYIGNNNLAGHYKYGYFIDFDAYIFIPNLSTAPRLTKGCSDEFVHAWNMSLPVKELLSHPDVLCFTEESHPEYFI